MLITLKKHIELFTTLLILTLFPDTSFARLTEIQKLRFGEFIIHDNQRRNEITIEPDGSYTFSNTGLIEIRSPQTGIYNIDNLPSNTIVNVSVRELRPLLGGNNFFKLKNFRTVYDNTDAAGTLLINLGATVETSGNGLPYSDDHYKGEIQIEINY